MVKLQGGISPVHQPVFLMRSAERNELIKRPSVGIDHKQPISTAITVTLLLLRACARVPPTVSLGWGLPTYSRRDASSAICSADFEPCTLIASSPAVVFGGC